MGATWRCTLRPGPHLANGVYLSEHISISMRHSMPTTHVRRELSTHAPFHRIAFVLLIHSTWLLHSSPCYEFTPPHSTSGSVSYIPHFSSISLYNGPPIGIIKGVPLFNVGRRILCAERGRVGVARGAQLLPVGLWWGGRPVAVIGQIFPLVEANKQLGLGVPSLQCSGGRVVCMCAGSAALCLCGEAGHMVPPTGGSAGVPEVTMW